MQFKKYDSIEQFLPVVESFLLQNEALHNLPLGILYNIAKGNPHAKVENAPFFGLVEEDGEIILVTLMTPPYNLVLAGHGEQVDEALAVACSYFHDNKIHLPGVIGDNKLAEPFARLWSQRTNCHVESAMNQRIYKLVKVIPSKAKSGEFRQAVPADVPVLKDWIIAFQKESLNDDVPEENALKAAERGVAEERYHVWVDGGQLVSMAAKTRPGKYGITVGAVYTPPVHRGKGYASACVATLSQKLLDSGYQYVTLYTDLSNNTSNSIYMKIGYEPIGDSVMLRFIVS